MIRLYYDLFIDWSLLQFEPQSITIVKKLLRENIKFHPLFYFFAIILNILLRFIWLPYYFLLFFFSKYLGKN
jgi:hypothetical protein